jgi:hypothetical protein
MLPQRKFHKGLAPPDFAGKMGCRGGYSETRDALSRSHRPEVDATIGSGNLAPNSTGNSNPGFALILGREPLPARFHALQCHFVPLGRG